MRSSSSISEQAHAAKRGFRIASIAVRAAFLIVFVVNVQCALSFVFAPESFAPAYELSGVPGIVAAQGIGVAFLMWNATYPLVIIDPDRHGDLAWVVIAQQVIGLVGETWIASAVPAVHEVLLESIGKFIAFDAFGLVIMTAALLWHAFAKRCVRRIAANGD